MSETEMADKTKGFDRKNIALLFTNGVRSSSDKNSDDENYSEEEYT